MNQGFFLLFAAASVITALAVVLARNPVHSALALMACFLQISAIFVLLDAPLLAVIQIFVYVGAIMSARFGNQLLRGLVQANQRRIGIARPRVHGQHIFHRRHERAVGLRRIAVSDAA